MNVPTPKTALQGLRRASESGVSPSVDMTRNTDRMSTPRKRSGDSISDEIAPSKRSFTSQRPVSSSSRPTSSHFDTSAPFTSSASLSTSPNPPSFNILPVRSSVPLEDSKPATREHTVEPGLAVLGAPVTRFAELVTTLRDNGIGRLDIDLPQIVVVGDQSTGKSSLIEGVSGIKVPRKEGTCTRCPLEINLKATSQTWHCKISIVKLYGWQASATVADSSLGLGPWNTRLPQAIVEPFVEVSDKAEIPLWIARAQLAVLNPSKPIRSFTVPLQKPLDSDMTQEAFSPNVIRLDIAAPKLPSLSFFDLPGVIVQDQEEYVPAMIANLVKSYISSSRSLVLLTLPVDNDRANSSAGGLVKAAGAENRTIGIISKPDRLVPANIEQWREILDGRKFKLNLGYRVVMNPADPTVEHAEARRLERVFFNTDEYFRGPLGAFQDRFGTEKLQQSLSSQLLDMIRGCLPDIEVRVKSRVAVIEQELATLPKPPDGNVVFEVQQKLINLERHLTDIINNTAGARGYGGIEYKHGTHFFQNWHRSAQGLFEKLVQTAPQLDLPHLAISDDSTITIDSDSDENVVITPAKKKRSALTPVSSPIPISTSFTQRQQEDIDSTIQQCVKKFTLDQLRGHLHAFNGGVRGIGDPRVFESLFNESTQHWSGVLKIFLKSTADRCKKVVTDLVDQIFADLKETQLLQKIKVSALQFVGGLEQEQLKLSRRLLNIEKGKPLTLDSDGQEANKRLCFAQLMAQLHTAMVHARLGEMRAAETRVSTAEEKRISEQLKTEAHQYHQELHELAGTISYYKVAAKRFADLNALSVRNEFFHSLKIGLKLHVDKEIGLGADADIAAADQKLKELMVPSARDFHRRQDLEHELDLLQKAREDIRTVLASEDGYDESDMYDDEDVEL